MRLFLAFPVPSVVAEYATGLQRELREMYHVRARWTRRDAFHVTAVFLGEQPPDILPLLKKKVTDLLEKWQAPVLVYDGVAAFGRPPRVLVLEYADAVGRAFTELVTELRLGLVESGVSVSDSVLSQKPRAHLTLGRFGGRRDAGTLPGAPVFSRGRFAESAGLPVPSAAARGVVLDKLVLYWSELKPSGAEYRDMAAWRLGG